MFTRALIYSLFGGESRWVFVTGPFGDTVSFLLQCRIQKQETVRVRGIEKTNVGQGGAAGSPVHSSSHHLSSAFCQFRLLFWRILCGFLSQNARVCGRGRLLKQNSSFLQGTDPGTWFFVPFFHIKPLPSSFLSREPNLFLVFLLKPKYSSSLNFPVAKN